MKNRIKTINELTRITGKAAVVQTKLFDECDRRASSEKGECKSGGGQVDISARCCMMSGWVTASCIWAGVLSAAVVSRR